MTIPNFAPARSSPIKSNSTPPRVSPSFGDGRLPCSPHPTDLMSSANPDDSPAIGPSPAHSELRRKEGTWDVRCTYFMGGDASPIEVDGTETGQMLGDLWCNSRFQADMLGTPLSGNGSIGYDPVKKRYVGTWKDSATPFLYTFEGDFDSEGKVLEMSGENYDPVRGCPATYRSRVEFISDDEHLLDLSIDVPDGLPIKVLRYHYTRRK